MTKTSVFKAQRSLSRQAREHPQGLPTHQPLFPGTSVIPASLILSLLTQPRLESVIYLLWICCCCSVVKLFLTLYDPMDCSTPGFLVLHYLLLRFVSVESVMLSSHLILCFPLILLPSVFPSIRVFSSESAFHIRCPNYWSFSFSISPSNDYSGLISSRINWFDLLAVQGTLKRLLQHHNSEASTLQHSAFFIVEFSHPYVATGKTIAHQAPVSMEFSRQEHWSG